MDNRLRAKKRANVATKQPLTDAQRRQIAEHYANAEGATLANTAEHFGVSKTTVARIVEDFSS